MMEHTQASELITSYVRGELDEATSASLSRHLDRCSDCSLEVRAVQALLEPLDDETLTDLERAGLHRGVAASTRAGANREVVPETKQGWARVAPWLGAAAVIALLAVGIVSSDLGGGDDTVGSGDAASVQEGAGRARDESAPLEFGGPDIADEAAEPEALAAATEDSRASGSDAAGGEAFGRVAARFDPDAGSFKTRDLKRYAARREPFRGFAAAYSAKDADDLSDLYLQAIQNAAPSGEGKSLIRTCALQVLEQDFPIVPAYGAYGRFDGRDVLVLGFVYAPNGGDLSRYLVWVWPREDCSTPVKIIAGRIVR